MSNTTTKAPDPIWTDETTNQLPVSQSSVTVEHFHTNIHFVYIIVGVAAVLGALFHLINVWFSGWNLQRIGRSRTQMKVITDRESDTESKCLCCVTIGILCAMVVFYSLVLETFASFVISFTVDHLSWTMSSATTLASVFWGSISLSMLIGTVLSNFIQPTVLLALECSLSLAGAVVLACALLYTPVALWVGFVTVGVGMGSIVPTALGVGKDKTQYTSMLSSTIMTSMYVGRIAAPPIIGYLLDNEDPMWFAYIGVVYTSAIALLFTNFVCVALLSRSCVEKAPEVVKDEKVNDSLVHKV